MPVKSVSDDRLWSVEDLSNYLGIPVPTLYRWRRCRCGPHAHRVGRHLRYMPAEVIAWLQDQP